MAEDEERASKRLKGRMGQYFEQHHSKEEYHRITTITFTLLQETMSQRKISEHYAEVKNLVAGGNFMVESQGAQNAIETMDPIERIELLSHQHGFKTRWMIFNSNHSWPRQVTIYLRLEGSTDSEDVPRIEVFKCLAANETSGKTSVAMQAIAWVASASSYAVIL